MALDLYNSIQAMDYRKSPVFLSAPPVARKIMMNEYANRASVMRNAVRYEVSDNALNVAIDIIRRNPSQFLTLVQHLALPSETVYIEWDMLAFNRLRHAAGFISGPVNSHVTRFGLLASGTKDDQTGAIRIEYFIEEAGFPRSGEAFFEFRGLSGSTWPAHQIVNYARGTGLPPNEAMQWAAFGSYGRKWSTDPKQGAALGQLLTAGISNKQEYLVTLGEVSTTPEMSAGTLTFALAFLSIIDAKPKFATTPLTASSKMRKSPATPARPYVVKWETVDMAATLRSTVSSIFRTSRARSSKIQHEVQEHWTYRRSSILPSCNHLWKPTGIRTQQRCVFCDGFRWKTIGHVRGDPSLGVKHVTHRAIV